MEPLRPTNELQLAKGFRAENLLVYVQGIRQPLRTFHRLSLRGASRLEAFRQCSALAMLVSSINPVTPLRVNSSGVFWQRGTAKI